MTRKSDTALQKEGFENTSLSQNDYQTVNTKFMFTANKKAFKCIKTI